MPKRYLLVATCLVLFGIGLAVQAQDDPAPTQSVGDAVGTLLAQTQQAPTQVNMTQTVQAALEQALTATAQAATPIPVDASIISVLETDEFDLTAGPGNTGVYFAPDGTRFVHSDRENFCLYTQDGPEPRCTAPPDSLPLDPETIRWSPDSRYITFTENFFVMFVDADIWVWDTTTDSVANLTDDGANRLDISSDNWSNIDLAPNWLPDGRIVFLRYNRVDDVVVPPEIYALDPNSGDLELLGSLENSDAFAIFALDATDDHVFFNYFLNDSPLNGVWMSELDGSNQEQLIASKEQLPPFNIDVSPDGRYALLNLPVDGRDFDAEHSPVQLIDLENSSIQLIDPDRFVVGAGWSPDGSALAYLVNDPFIANEDRNGLYITGTPGEAGRQVLPGNFNLLTPRRYQSLVWGANNYILLSRSPEQGIVLAQLGISSD